MRRGGSSSSLDEAGGVVREVGELAVDTALLHRGVVEFAEFALRRVKPAGDLAVGILGSRSVVGESQNSFVAVSSCWWISSPATSPSSSWSYSRGSRPYSLRSTAAGRD